MLTGVHFLLTYTCNFECDHCFLFCSPRSKGTFTLDQVTQVLDEARRMGTVEWIFFEGGEPLLFFPLLVECTRLASRAGFKVGIVTNAYGAIVEPDADLWLEPLADAGVSYLSISNDTFHYGQETQNPAAIASLAAERLGIPTAPICIEAPEAGDASGQTSSKGRPVVGGGPKFRGRAAEMLTDELPRRPWQEMQTCPYEELVEPQRVHVDSFGHVHICQGISMGNMWDTPLSELVSAYRCEDHPVCGPLVQGGPAQLARSVGFAPQDTYVDECHLCYLTRRAMIPHYPDILAPAQVYDR